MADQKFTPRGSIGTNRFKKSDTHPDLTGKVFLTSEIVANIQEQVSEGVEYPVVELAVWKKTSSKDGSKFLSVAASKPWKKSGNGRLTWSLPICKCRNWMVSNLSRQ